MDFFVEKVGINAIFYLAGFRPAHCGFAVKVRCRPGSGALDLSLSPKVDRRSLLICSNVRPGIAFAKDGGFAADGKKGTIGL
jgi:hypothetical protein